jgi:hypothetical protein
MMVTKDEYELPMAIADTPTELANLVGTTRAAIHSQIGRAKKSGKRCRYVKVILDDDEE